MRILSRGGIDNDKKIAVMTSGGDAPGMNAAIRAAVRTAVTEDIEVVGIKRGYSGLLDEDFIEMSYASVGGIMEKGAQFLEVPDVRSSKPLKEEREQQIY